MQLAQQPAVATDPLDRILAGGEVTPRFQPILRLGDGEIIGYEALARGPEGDPLHHPADLFSAAMAQERLVELENLCRRRAIEAFPAQSLPGKLFLNITPDTLLQSDFQPGVTRRLLQGHGTSPEHAVVELTEHSPTEYDVLRQAADHYRCMGLSIALDDLGTGYSGLRLWSELRPDYVKLDQHFIRGVDRDLVKQEFVRSIQEIALGIGCQVIAEGIETAEELRVIRSMEIPLGQGYFFGYPQAEPPRSLPPGALGGAAGAEQRVGRRFQLTDTAASVGHEAPALFPDTRLRDVGEAFRTHHDLHTLPVIEAEGGRPVGVVHRSRFMELFLLPYGRDLYGRRPISRFMDRAPLVVEHDTPVERVSQRITEAQEAGSERDFVITRGGGYHAMGSVLDLLRKITDLQIRNARYANPLTLLPGNVPIYDHIDRLLEAGQAFCVAYCDLDHFKPFNDVYGYSRGDEVIKAVAQSLVRQADRQRDFVGHIGGDDFILVLRSADPVARCERMLHSFEAQVPAFYSDEDRARGGLTAKDRTGSASFFPLLSLSVGVAYPDPAHCLSHHDVASLASEAKHQAKQRPGNAVFVERRRKPSGLTPS